MKLSRVMVELIPCCIILLLSVGGTVEGRRAPGQPFDFGRRDRDRTYEEAPSGFDNLTNGFLAQDAFDEAKEAFEEKEETDEGVGPVYNALSCAECHQNPITGGISQITELRAGRADSHTFTQHPGGSLINDRAIHPSMQERVLPGYDVRTFRTSLNTLGDGFVESIADETFEEIADRQPSQMRGEVILVPVAEGGGALAVGRFGWKNQHASLLSFSADAYLNEMGITSPLQPVENTSNGQSVAAYDAVPDPEDLEGDVDLFAAFMRSTKAPSRDERLATTRDAQAGEEIFRAIGCAVCHVPSIVTAAPGTQVNAGMFVVPEALGNKIIHPFGDFLMHNIGTGDGIVQNGGPVTRNKMRTAPLWGVRTRTRLMHDGQSLTFEDAILRHEGEASPTTNEFRRLSNRQKAQLFKFLESL